MEDILPLESVETLDAVFCTLEGFKLTRGNLIKTSRNMH